MRGNSGVVVWDLLFNLLTLRCNCDKPVTVYGTLCEKTLNNHGPAHQILQIKPKIFTFDATIVSTNRF